VRPVWNFTQLNNKDIDALTITKYLEEYSCKEAGGKPSSSVKARIIQAVSTSLIWKVIVHIPFQNEHADDVTLQC
jgi:hypothetical protein